MILHNMSQSVHKHCNLCQRDTEHTDILKWICLPNYLILTINRFAYVDGRTIKRDIDVPIQTHVSIDGSNFTLIGIIHHHGNSANSGHYTCTLIHDSMVFDCNDRMITRSSNF